jgi:putative membrane-bound dehydrogenase-like protein
MNNHLLNALTTLLAIAACSHAAELPTSVKTPPGWKVTLFATPPDVSYPTCLSTSPEGDLYVGIDENGSIDAKPGRGRVVRCTDTNNDGVADKFVTFAKMDSPRGIWFDHNVLYVQHPPFVEAFIDDNGDGVADRSDVLVKGLGFDLKFRGADHTINGIRMGIDGFLYIACGDYGGTNVVAKDGTTLQLHGGGVVRVRPDGTGLEIVSRGQRNIYDVAVSPEMDLFTRDNTNDGDGWDVRLSHVVMGGNYGYPTLYKKFGDEIVQPLADYGGGSPCGALFMDEPGFPDGLGRGLYTVEWGRGGVFRHPLTQNGASFKAQQEEFVKLSRPTDFDVDGSGRLYISSWHGATFTYNGPNAGFIVQVTPPTWTFKAAARPEKSSDEDVLKQLSGPSAFARLYAQREILRRGAKPLLVSSLEKIAMSDRNSGVRVAAIFTLKQLLGEKAEATLVRLAKQDNIREFALRALADPNPIRRLGGPRSDVFIAALSDANPRVRLQAVTALGRVGKKETAASMLPLVADSDPVVSHVAINALAMLRAPDVCLATFDSPGNAALQPGAARVLQQLHEPSAVDGIIAKLGRVSDTHSRRTLLGALARLYNREADWDGRWWGTRPDSTGPYFKPVTWSESEKIANVFKPLIANADGETIRWLVVTLQKNRVDLPELTAVALKLASEDEQFRPVIVELFSGRNAMPDEAVPLFAAVAKSERTSSLLRLKAIRALNRSGKSGSFEAALGAIVAITEQKNPDGDLNSAWEEFARDTRNAQRIAALEKLAISGTPAERTVAFGALTSLATGRLSNREAKAAATRAVEQGWTKPDTAVPLLRSISKLRNDAYALQVRSLLTDRRADVAAAAKQAASALRLNQKREGVSAPMIEALEFEQVVAEAQKQKGEARVGRELFTKAGCIACHTTRNDEPPKGPFLGDIATRYNRAELCESILKPSAKIAQGFETQWFKTKDDSEYEGFVTREGGDDLDLRNVAGITTTLAKKEIIERGKREKSIMPEGLADKLTTSELASLLAFLDTLKSK